jgi:hypothetical protein
MSFRRPAFGAIASALTLLSLVTGHALAAEPREGGAQVSLAISGHVALRCNAQLEVVSGSAESISEGRLVESCNDPRGYELHADYPSELEHTKLSIDGVTVELDGSGSVVVARSARPQRTIRQFTVEASTGAGSTAEISFRIVPASRRI